MRKKSILAQLGVKSITTIAHGEISIAKAIQACALSALLATGITYLGQYQTPDYAAAMSAPGQTVHFDPASGVSAPLTLAFDTETGEVGYIAGGAFRLEDRFRADLEAEINTITAQAELAGSWDLYIGSKLTFLLNSESPEERQVGNAVLGFITEHTGHAPVDLPKAAYYTRTHATEIESARQAFAMADAMREALIGSGKSRISRPAAESALSKITDEPDTYVAAFNVLSGIAPNQDGPQDILPLVESAIEVETSRLSLTSMAGQMFGIAEIAEEPAGEAIMLSRRVGKPISIRVHSGRFEDHYESANTEPTNETLTQQIKTGFDLSPGLAIEGRGALLSRIPMPGESPTRLPDFRHSLQDVVRNSNFEIVDTIIENESFKISM